MKIQIILGSIRPGRNGEKVLEWVKSQLQDSSEVEYEYIDLKDWNLPYELEANPPKMKKYENPEVIKWSQKINEGDGYIIITPEYNHGYSAPLKNALDQIFFEWNKKPVGFVSYGGPAGGARSVEQLRLVAVELDMVPLRSAVLLPVVWEGIKEDLAGKALKDMVDQLLWWAKALKVAREQI